MASEVGAADGCGTRSKESFPSRVSILSSAPSREEGIGSGNHAGDQEPRAALEQLSSQRPDRHVKFASEPRDKRAFFFYTAEEPRASARG